jgi:hypothetical protein
MEQMIELQLWRCIDGYRLFCCRAGMRSASARFEQYRPLETPDLFATFADMPHTEEGMLKFCNRFGLLRGGRPDIPRSRNKPTKESESVKEQLRHHAAIQYALSLFEKGHVSQLAKQWNEAGGGWMRGAALMRIELRDTANGRLSLVLVPPDLIGAIWIQLAEHACSGARLFRCDRCNKPFTVGAGTGRRRTAMYCSNACKVAAFQARQRGED